MDGIVGPMNPDPPPKPLTIGLTLLPAESAMKTIVKEVEQGIGPGTYKPSVVEKKLLNDISRPSPTFANAVPRFKSLDASDSQNRLISG